ncbi:MAG: hypothetical protein ACE5I7_01170 [Candidatus Binatia bacterium]
MAETTTCEQCGTVITTDTVHRVVVEDWIHYFCSERCKIEWGEEPEIEDEE